MKPSSNVIIVNEATLKFLICVCCFLFGSRFAFRWSSLSGEQRVAAASNHVDCRLRSMSCIGCLCNRSAHPPLCPLVVDSRQRRPLVPSTRSPCPPSPCPSQRSRVCSTSPTRPMSRMTRSESNSHMWHSRICRSINWQVSQSVGMTAAGSNQRHQQRIIHASQRCPSQSAAFDVLPIRLTELPNSNDWHGLR